jgi:uncharacterized protein involved in exopolysaccharide biosynthesis
LLRAYPSAHRADYGAAMAQLFRDQCRDAWREAGGWGLTKLWLRVLPDWASTSVRERIAALNERKTMNDKLASLARDRSTPRAIFFRVAAAVFLLTLTIATIVTFTLPAQYASESKLLLKFTGSSGFANNSVEQQAILFEVQMLCSFDLFASVANDLELNTIWGKRYANGISLKTPETTLMLQDRVTVARGRQSGVIQIKVLSDDKNEPARIASSLIHAYQNLSAKVHSVNDAADEHIQNELTDLRVKIVELDKKTAALRKQFKIGTDATGPQSPEDQPFWDAKSELAKIEQTYKQQAGKLEAARMAEALAPGHLSNITVIESPTPAYQVSTRPRIFFRGAVLGVFLGMLAGGVAARLAGQRGNRTPPTIAAP